VDDYHYERKGRALAGWIVPLLTIAVTVALVMGLRSIMQDFDRMDQAQKAYVVEQQRLRDIAAKECEAKGGVMARIQQSQHYKYGSTFKESCVRKELFIQ
jgi:hypothetical protein